VTLCERRIRHPYLDCDELRPSDLESRRDDTGESPDWAGCGHGVFM